MKKYVLIFFAICLLSISFATEGKRRLPTGATPPSEVPSTPSPRIQEILKARGYDFSVKKPNRFRIKNAKGEYGFINDSGEVVIPPKFKDANDFSEGLAAIKYYISWGYIDTAGKIVIQCQYEKANDFKDGFAKVKYFEEGEKDNKGISALLADFSKIFTGDDYEYGLINKQGTVIVPAKTYNHIASKGFFSDLADYYFDDDLAVDNKIFNNGLAFVGKKIKGDTIKYGFIDQTGKLVIDCIYDDVYSFQNGLARVMKNGKWGIINTNNKWVVKPEYDFIGAFSESLANFRKDDNYGYLDMNGNIVIKPQFSKAQYFSEGLARVKTKGAQGYSYIDKKGNIVFSLPSNVEDASAFSNGLARIRIGRRYGYIDKTGKIVIPVQFQLAREFQDGLAQVGDIKGDTTKDYDNPFTVIFTNTIFDTTVIKYGLIDKNGNYVVAKKYELIGAFVDDIALVKLNYRYGFIRRDGSYLVEPIFEYAESFKNGLAKVELNGKEAYIDKTGRVVWQQQ
ncbi:MAG: WG repeat-containing protein [candidate division WOR-3 bacterium]